jgi:hypothetical protein
MSALPILAILVLVLLVVAALILRRRSRSATEDDPTDRLDTVAAWPPTATRLLGTNEILAYKLLVRALPGYMVLAKVPLARFVKVPSRHSYAEWLRRLGYQCADLVVCDMASEVVATVNVRRSAGELSERAVKRHKRMARVLKAAGIPLHVWMDDALPTPERARELLLPGSANPIGELPRAIDAAAAAAREEPREPPPSTWFDDFNTGPAPLDAGARVAVSSTAPARTRER